MLFINPVVLEEALFCVFVFACAVTLMHLHHVRMYVLMAVFKKSISSTDNVYLHTEWFRSYIYIWRRHY